MDFSFWHGAQKAAKSAVPGAQLVTFRWRRACRLRGQSAGSSLHSEAAEQVYFKKAHRVFLHTESGPTTRHIAPSAYSWIPTTLEQRVDG